MPKIFYIHGLNSSHTSFSYISAVLGETPKVNYNSYQSLDKSILQVTKQIPKDEPIVLVGHSLGGLIAAIIADTKTRNVEKLITISAPLGGSKAAVFARWVMRGLPILSDITPQSKWIKGISKMEQACPTLSIISTGGSLPTSTEPNDSVVTVSSQKALKFAKKIEVKASHFEILQHTKTVEAIRGFIDGQKPQS